MAILSNWLKRRLTPVKRDTPAWADFAEAIEQYWEENFDPYLTRIQNLRSIFTADDDSLQKRMLELGGYFQADLPDPENRAIAVAWRRGQLQKKETLDPLIETLYCLFSGLPIEWTPLYAPKAEDYGTEFLQAEEIEGAESEYFLTSRGRLFSDLGHLHRTGFTKAEFIERSADFIANLIPLHILYEGPSFYLTFDIQHPTFPYFCGATEHERRFPILATWRPRFDIVPADVRPLDWEPISFWQEHEKTAAFSMEFTPVPWTLDMFWREPMPPDFPADTVIPGFEGALLPPLRAFALHESTLRMDMAPAVAEPGVPEAVHSPSLEFGAFPAVLDRAERECATEITMAPDVSTGHLDDFASFDLLPADFAPLDMPTGGYLYA